MDNQKFVQAQAFTLAGAGTTIGDTSITITLLQDIDGNNLAMTDFGDKGWMTIEPGSSSREEQISFTGITQNANGTATLTGIKNVGFLAPYTETSGVLKSHPGGVKIVVSNTSAFYDSMSSKKNDETIEGVYIFTEPNVPRMDTAHTYGAGEEEYFATKRYADSLAIAGAPDASTTQKGIIEIATTAEAIAGTPTGGTGALLVAPNSLVNQTPSATEIIPLTDGAGKLPAGFGGNASTLATLNGSSKVVEDPANATATPTASKIPIADGNGNLDSWISQININTKSLTAGETINGATLPVAIYQSEVDNKIYVCDGNDVLKLDFIGFAITNSTDTNPITIQVQGVVSGFTGLIEGFDYFVQDDKTIGTAKGTYPVFVGKAISETEILIEKKWATETIASNTLIHSNGTEQSTVSTSYVKLKEILVNEYIEIARIKFSGKISALGGNGRIYVNGSPVGTEQAFNTTSYIEKSEDLTLNLVPNDLIQIYAKATATSTTFIQGLGIYFDRQITIPPITKVSTNQDP